MNVPPAIDWNNLRFDMLMPGQDTECVDCGALLGPGKFIWCRSIEGMSFVSQPVCELCTFRILSAEWPARMAELRGGYQEDGDDGPSDGGATGAGRG